MFAVRTAVATGCTTIVLTNAAGGAGDGMAPGDLVLIKDHLNLTGRNPLTGANDDRLGPRFPDMSAVYPQALRDLARGVGERVGVRLGEGCTPGFSARRTRRRPRCRWLGASAPISSACRRCRRR